MPGNDNRCAWLCKQGSLSDRRECRSTPAALAVGVHCRRREGIVRSRSKMFVRQSSHSADVPPSAIRSPVGEPATMSHRCCFRRGLCPSCSSTGAMAFGSNRLKFPGRTVESGNRLSSIAKDKSDAVTPRSKTRFPTGSHSSVSGAPRTDDIRKWRQAI
jgi:hypothetical protein